MTKETHQYIKNKIRALRGEYKGKDYKEIISNAGGKCSICRREDGDTYLFGPTLYLKKQIQFRVKIGIHVVRMESSTYNVLMCDGCHCSYHLFNRLGKAAKFGRKKLSATVYKKQ